MEAVPDDLKRAALLEGVELDAAIGAGRFARVWSARYRGDAVAFRLLHDADGPRPRSLNHPGILSARARGRLLGRPYQILPLFPADLRQVLGGRPLARRLQRPVLMTLLDALEHAHQRGVIHGDLKPANVLLDPSSARTALGDFGTPADVQALEASILSAERSELAGTASTLPYLAPERIAGGSPTRAADVFAFGVLLFEVLTGRLPVGLELPSELNPSLDRRVDALAKRLLSRLPERRPGLGEVRRELLRVLPGAEGDSERLPRPPAPQDMVYVAADRVVFGDRDDRDASPMFEASLPAYWIDATPVTNADYAAFVAATGAAPPRAWRGGRPPGAQARWPVSGVSWHEAQAYAAWLGKRLPTEREWERAAMGPEHRSYPYGEGFDPTRIVREGLASVDELLEGASSEGVRHLTGNGWEWTASPFVRYGQPGPAPNDARTIRGGYDPNRPAAANAHTRRGFRPDAADHGLTFRCAMDPERGPRSSAH
ncbi:MAG: SUMF1/EgtB/PvdO family nonheme iron enzyme [Planctomycetes bacterium]|nr:SUMF1/EgtB/PvdO family nonheme iron enzyme [Planctomycetota bacterium]